MFYPVRDATFEFYVTGSISSKGMGPHMIGLIMNLLPGFPDLLVPGTVFHSNITGFPV